MTKDEASAAIYLLRRTMGQNGPYRKVVDARFTPSAWLVTFDCGHTSEKNPSQSWEGETHGHCFLCLSEAEKAIKAQVK